MLEFSEGNSNTDTKSPVLQALFCKQIWHFDILGFGKSIFAIIIYCYNPPNNFCGLSLDKTDHVIQDWTMDIRGYPPSDLISVVSFYCDGRKTSKHSL